MQDTKSGEKMGTYRSITQAVAYLGVAGTLLSMAQCTHSLNGDKQYENDQKAIKERDRTKIVLDDLASQECDGSPLCLTFKEDLARRRDLYHQQEAAVKEAENRIYIIQQKVGDDVTRGLIFMGLGLLGFTLYRRT